MAQICSLSDTSGVVTHFQMDIIIYLKLKCRVVWGTSPPPRKGGTLWKSFEIEVQMN